MVIKFKRYYYSYKNLFIWKISIINLVIVIIKIPAKLFLLIKK